VTVVTAVSFGNFLEWYEVYLYIYWAPTLAKLFFQTSASMNSLIYTYVVFALGFLARPLGGLFFGRLGDRLGRRTSMLLSIFSMIVPTLIIGMLPTYSQIGLLAPCLLTLMRLLQAFPTGGELPGSMCYLYESAEPHKRALLCSFTFSGVQLGVLVSVLECYFLEHYLSPEQLLRFGWRASFLVGGLFGFGGLYLRYKLHETPLFQDLVRHGQVIKKSLFYVLYEYKKEILIASFFYIMNSSVSYWLSVNILLTFSTLFGSHTGYNILFDSLWTLFITLPLPLFGLLGQRFGIKKILILATVASMLLLYPLTLTLNSPSFMGLSITVGIFSLLFSCLAALIPYALCDLFPTYVRFTGVAASFNFVDVFIGGFTPAIALFLFRHTGKFSVFSWILLISGILSLIAFWKMPYKRHPFNHPTS